MPKGLIVSISSSHGTEHYENSNWSVSLIKLFANEVNLIFCFPTWCMLCDNCLCFSMVHVLFVVKLWRGRTRQRISSNLVPHLGRPIAVLHNPQNPRNNPAPPHPPRRRRHVRRPPAYCWTTTSVINVVGHVGFGQAHCECHPVRHSRGWLTNGGGSLHSTSFTNEFLWYIWLRDIPHPMAEIVSEIRRQLCITDAELSSNF